MMKNRDLFIAVDEASNKKRRLQVKRECNIKEGEESRPNIKEGEESGPNIKEEESKLPCNIKEEESKAKYEESKLEEGSKAKYEEESRSNIKEEGESRLLCNIKEEESKAKYECLDDKGSEKRVHPPFRKAGPLGSWRICEYYDSSGTALIPRIYPLEQAELVYFSHLAIWSYNLKEETNFDDVQLLRAKRRLDHVSDYYITFQAFSPDRVATTFQSKIRFYYPRTYPKVMILFVRIRPSDSESDEFAEDSQQDQPSKLDKIYLKRLSQLVRTQIYDSQFKLAISLSQYALVNYNLKVNDETAMHDIASLKIVKPMKRIRKAATYRITFEASLCDDSENVETFEIEICMPTLFPTTTIEFKDLLIKPN